MRASSIQKQSGLVDGHQNQRDESIGLAFEKMCRLTLPFFIALVCMSCTHVWGFSSLQSSATASRIRKIRRSSTSDTVNRRPTLLGATASDGKDPDEIIATRIIVTGDVNGGYYRSCVKNEAGRFRKLIGTMSPPDSESQRAEIYVEGKRKMIGGFVRWCERGNVGLSQKIAVESVSEEDAEGLLDDFYVQTGREET